MSTVQPSATRPVAFSNEADILRYLNFLIFNFKRSQKRNLLQKSFCKESSPDKEASPKIQKLNGWDSSPAKAPYARCTGARSSEINLKSSIFKDHLTPCSNKVLKQFSDSILFTQVLKTLLLKTLWEVFFSGAFSRTLFIALFNLLEQKRLV